MKAWYFDNIIEVDQREPHILSPDSPHFLSAKEVYDKSGVEYFQIDTDAENWMEHLELLCQERQYKNRDELTCSKDKLPNYEEKIKSFFEEHIHEDEEIRFILGGGGYFDVRDTEDKWIRIFVEKNDLIILPAGIYHRFTLDRNDCIHVIRLFKDDPKWTPINRPFADGNKFRQEYLQQFNAKSSVEWQATQTSAPLKQ
jgi:1,2-dihydroxy-3-keto-5-methylthiopentene dioxygenase